MGRDNYWWPLLKNSLCTRDCIVFMERVSGTLVTGSVAFQKTHGQAHYYFITYYFHFNSVKLRGILNLLAILICEVIISKRQQQCTAVNIHPSAQTWWNLPCSVDFWSNRHQQLSLDLQVELCCSSDPCFPLLISPQGLEPYICHTGFQCTSILKQFWNHRKHQQVLVWLEIDDWRAASPIVTVCGLPTWSEVHVVLVVAALQGVEGSCDLAGELLAAVHALPLQMVAQVGDVVFVSSEEATI